VPGLGQQENHFNDPGSQQNGDHNDGFAAHSGPNSRQC
jgi:hypothetical protein